MNREAMELVRLAKDLMASDPFENMAEKEKARATEVLTKLLPELEAAAGVFVRALKKLYPGVVFEKKSRIGTNYRHVYPEVSIATKKMGDSLSSPFFTLRAMFRLERLYRYSNEVILSDMWKYEAQLFWSGNANPDQDAYKDTAKDAVQDILRELRMVAEKHPDVLVKTLGIDVYQRPGATKPTIDDVIAVVKKESWFELDEKEPNWASFTTREHGNVGEEQAGSEDIRMANKIRKVLLDKYGSNNIKVELEVVDEWVDMSVSIR